MAPRQVQRIQTASLVMLGTLVASGVIILLWLIITGQVDRVIDFLQGLQDRPPLWLEVPMVAQKFLLAPTVLLLLLALGVMQVSPEPRPWSRFVVVAILMGLTVRYLLWRSLSTLNLDDPLDGIFSVGLLGMEGVMLTGSFIQFLLLLRVKDRRKQADQMAIAVERGLFRPKVDILIPTYDEPAFILRRTVIGCQAIDYPETTIYLLDDTRRPAIQALAAELGCEYRTRPDNRHAKAGNLNAILPHLQGELVVVFDADFVPTRNFLNRTVGFFQDERIGLVQTPQSFYNPDPIATNLGLEQELTPEEEVFYRQIQPMRDGAGSVICAGTSFVVRRRALEEVGGFTTESLSEDYFTGIRLAAQGYQVIYLDEKLSAGLAAENLAAHATQRLRWARGTLQAFFIDANPLTIPGLNVWQRLGHFEGLLHWFSSLPRIYFLAMPLAYAFFGVIPLKATSSELLYFFLPYYLTQLAVFAWLNHRSRSALLSDIYTLVLVFPLALTVFHTLLHPFSKGFKVTPKGTVSDRFSFNWSLALPLILLFGLTALSLWKNLGLCVMSDTWVTGDYGSPADPSRGLGLGWIWSSYNLLMLSIALLILLDVPRPDPHPWFELRRVVRLTLLSEDPDHPSLQTWWGVTSLCSEVGAEIIVTQAGLPALEPGTTLPIKLEIVEVGLQINAEVVAVMGRDDDLLVQVKFGPMELHQMRRLVTMLFCRPGQWRRHRTPNELQSLWLLARVLLRPQVLFQRSPQIRAVALAKY